MNCPRCGKPVTGDNIICDSCGLIFNNSSSSNAKENFNENINNNEERGSENNHNFNRNYSNYAEQVTFKQLLNENGITEEEVAAFIGQKNKGYYLNAFNKITTGRSYHMVDYLNSRARNFSLGKILSIFWILYRKMFQEFIIGLAIIVGASIIGGIFGGIFLVGWVISFAAGLVPCALWILIMIYGDQIYRDFVIKRVKEIKQMYGNSPNYYAILGSSGGTLI